MISVSSLTKVFGDTRAVDDLSFTVNPGQVTGFLGPNGAGKSTTMRMILGLDNPTRGTATVNGKAYHSLDNPLRHVGSLLDANWIHPNRSARSHLKWMAALNQLPAQRADEVLDLVGLSKVASKRAGEFSLGMKQRLGIAGALLGDPGVLLFDEPVNGLDPEGILWIRTMMRSLAKQGRTVLVSSHLLSEMAVTADHLIVIGRGRMIADQPTKEFIDAATQSTVTVRSPRLADLRGELLRRGFPVQDGEGALEISNAPIEQVGEIAGAAGIVLHELSAHAGSLEQAFMRMTGHAVEFSGEAGGPGAVPPGAVPPGAFPPGAAVPHPAPYTPEGK